VVWVREERRALRAESETLSGQPAGRRRYS
jgi:hypothetical protein